MTNIWNKTILTSFALCILLQSGCVQRRILVRSNPEGALVTVDRQPIGHTPVAFPITFYGTREIQLEMDGFQTKKVKHRVDAPWYQIPPLDFITDNFWPREIRDDRVVDFELTPKTTVDENILLERAGQLRGNVYRGLITPPLAHERSDSTLIESPPAAQTAGTPVERR